MVVMAMCMGDRGRTKECALLAMIYYRPAAGAMVWNVSRHPAEISKFDPTILPLYPAHRVFNGNSSHRLTMGNFQPCHRLYPNPSPRLWAVKSRRKGYGGFFILFRLVGTSWPFGAPRQTPNARGSISLPKGNIDYHLLSSEKNMDMNEACLLVPSTIYIYTPDEPLLAIINPC